MVPYTVKNPKNQWCSGVSIVWTCFTPCSSVSTVNFEQVITDWACSLNARKYKVAGTTGLLLNFPTASHKTVLENPSTAPWMGNPQGFILSSYHNHRSKKHKRFVTIIHRHHLPIKLVSSCYSVKLLSGSKCLTIRRVRSILNCHVFLNDNSFWLSGCIYLLTSKRQQTETPYLASLLCLIQN